MNLEEIIAKAREYYAIPGNGCGGSLHIVLDDGNVDRASVEFCLDWARRENDQPGIQLAEILLTLTEGQRQEVYEELF